MCGHNEGKGNFNKGNYCELLNCFAEIDNLFALRFCTKGYKSFSRVSSTIQIRL